MTDSAPQQMSLGVSLSDYATFANFYTAAANKPALRVLSALSDSDTDILACLVWGGRGSGLTHLLQATCHRAYANGRSVQFLPMDDIASYPPNDILDGLEGTSLVCLDGIDSICGVHDWEKAIFHLYNNLRDAGHSLVLSTHNSPASLPVVLADLKSRIMGSMFVHVESLSDDDKQSAMIMRAQGRGMELSREVAKYLLSRASRDTHELFAILDKLDGASLQQQRKLTIPFVREIVGF